MKILKINIVLLVIFGFLFYSRPNSALFAIDATSSPSVTKQSSDSTLEKLRQIQELKEKVATKVGQLRQSSQGAISGFIKEIKENKIAVVTKKGDQTITVTDDVIYKILENNEKKEISFKKLAPNQLIAAFGHFDENSRDFITKIILVSPVIKNIAGKIADIDKANFTITVKEKQGTTLVDIEKYSKTYEYQEAGKNWQKSGFSRLKVGDFVHIIGVEDSQEQNRIHSSKIYSLTFIKPPSTADSTQSLTPAASPDKP